MQCYSVELVATWRIPEDHGENRTPSDHVDSIHYSLHASIEARYLRRQRHFTLGNTITRPVLEAIRRLLPYLCSGSSVCSLNIAQQVGQPAAYRYFGAFERTVGGLTDAVFGL